MASRYESVATRRSPPSCAASNTPVRIGRASSFDAAGTTWRSASDNAAAPTVTPFVGTSGSRGKSFADNVRNVVANRPASMCASSPTSSTVTVSASRRARMSANRRAGSTTLPSPSPWAGVVTRIVSSRSEPTSSTDPVTKAHPEPGQHWQGTGPRRHRALGGGDRVGQGLDAQPGTSRVLLLSVGPGVLGFEPSGLVPSYHLISSLL